MSGHSLILSDGSTLPKPRTNIAIVAVKDGRVMQIHGRIALRDRLFGAPKHFIEVDTSEKSFDEKVELPSWSDAIFFDGRVHLIYRVSDPETLIETGIRNGKETLWPVLCKMLKDSTRGCEKAGEAQAVCARVAEQFQKNINFSPVSRNGLEVRHIAVEVRLPQEMIEATRTRDLNKLQKEALTARHEQEDIKVKREEEFIQGGIPRLWARHLQMHPEAAADAIAAFSNAERERFAAQIQILRDAINNNLLEDHLISKHFNKDFMERVFARASGAAALPPIQEGGELPRIEAAPKAERAE